MQGHNVHSRSFLSPHVDRQKTPFKLSRVTMPISPSAWKLRGFDAIPPMKQPVGWAWGDSAPWLPWLLSGALLCAGLGWAVVGARSGANIAPVRPAPIKTDRLPILAADEPSFAELWPGTVEQTRTYQNAQNVPILVGEQSASFTGGTVPAAQNAQMRANAHRNAHPVDPVCGPKGRYWYSNERGWRYWRCRR